MTSATCSIRPAVPAMPLRVRVNGIEIPRAAIARETQCHPASKPVAAWLAAAQALVVRELLLQEARRLGLAAVAVTDAEGRRETDEEAAIRTLVETEVKVPRADESEVRRYYECNRRRFRSADLCEVRHILIAARNGEAGDSLRERAEALAEAVRRDAGCFAGLAAQWSACPSAQSGGSLGQIGPGQTVPEFEQGLAAMSEGDTSVIETRYGLHVVRLERRLAGRELPLELVRAKIADWLEERVRRTAIRQYIHLLAGRAEITGIELASSRSPLVQ